MKKEEMLTFLIDQCGFIYHTASKIVEREDASTFVSCMKFAYDKGKASVYNSYRYNNG